MEVRYTMRPVRCKTTKDIIYIDDSGAAHHIQPGTEINMPELENIKLQGSKND